jgi:superfamily I DNA and/or RNA helicase
VEREKAVEILVQELRLVRAEMDEAIERDPTVRAHTERVVTAEAAAAGSEEAARQAAERLARLLQGVEPAPAPVDPAAFAEWYGAHEPMLRERAQLLTEWRTRLRQPSEQLHAELIRYADVIGATCIGVGVQRNQLADLDFDLAVIDEAGQITLPSTLVPLTRARRAVLVGDHHQLPPFDADDVRKWLADRHPTARNRELVHDLLANSAFERLLREAPQHNQVMLDRQRRMPAVLAEFISEHFYGGLLTTGDRDDPPAPIFGSPLAVIDTSDLPLSQRTERRRERTETWQTAGCDNRAEAGIVLRLVKWCAAHGRDWAVIAPYRAQVQLIDLRAREMLGDDAVRDRIGTVDAFQGQERDVVIFSFTRSNVSGSVGFLGEPRRLNVAMSRARDQLVLVGDRQTLTHACDAGFRHLACRLFEFAGRYGEIISAGELPDRLR